MYRYVLKRIFLMVPVVLAVTFLVFAIIELTPGNPAKMMLGKNASEEAVEKLSKELGYDKPFVVRYVKYIANAARGDFGKSYKTKASVVDEIFSRFPVTIRITFFVSLYPLL